VYVKYLDDFRFTQYADKCVQILERCREYESDVYLVQLVRLQRIAEEVHQSIPRYNLMGSLPVQASIVQSVKTLQMKLDQFGRNLPSHLKQNRKSLLH
jgi:hypothetical protein